MRVLEAARRGRIRLVPDDKGGMMVEGRRRDVASIAAAVKKRERKAAKRAKLADEDCTPIAHERAAAAARVDAWRRGCELDDEKRLARMRHGNGT